MRDFHFLLFSLIMAFSSLSLGEQKSCAILIGASSIHGTAEADQVLSFQASSQEFVPSPSAFDFMDLAQGTATFRKRFAKEKDLNHYHKKGALKRSVVRDQCALGSCWINAALSLYEWSLSSRVGENLQLSDAYLFRHHLKRKAKHVFSGFDNANRIYQSSLTQTAVELAFTNGLVLEADYPLRLDLRMDAKVADRFITAFRIFVAELQENKQLSKLEKSKRVEEWLDQAMGPVPEKTLVGDKEISPTQLYGMATENLGQLKPELKSQQAWTLIKKSIDANQPVISAFDWKTEYINPELGFASLEAFGFRASTPERAKKYRWLPVSQDGHALMLIDYEMLNGRLYRVLAQNSHGEGRNDSGLIHIYADYFFAFHISSLIPSKIQEGEEK